VHTFSNSFVTIIFSTDSASSRYSPYPATSLGYPGSISSAPSVQKDQCNLYVCDISPSTSEAEFLSWFNGFGQIVSHTMLVNPETGLAKGIGFCRFASADQARIARDAVNGKVLPNASKPLSVSFAKDTSHKSNPSLRAAPQAYAAYPGYSPYAPASASRGAPAAYYPNYGTPAYDPYAQHPSLAPLSSISLRPLNSQIPASPNPGQPYSYPQTAAPSTGYYQYQPQGYSDGARSQPSPYSKSYLQ